MSYKFTVKKSIKCETCKGNGYFVFDNENIDNKNVEYYCIECEGKGVVWRSADLPLSSLKELLK
tara:strand:- start:223 stop:414 length:192 start_codon:yes stop_codon:yes gene_type:complete